MGALVATLCVGASVVAMGPPHWWACELASSLRFQLAAGASVAALILLPLRAWWSAAALGACVLVHAAPIVAQRLGPNPPPATHATVVRLASVNVLASNTSHDRLIPWLEAQDPDVVLLIEVDDAWAALIDRGTFARWPHHHVLPEGMDGMAVLSKTPLDRVDEVRVGRVGPAYLDARVTVRGCALRLVGLHTYPPVTPALHSARDRLLGAVAGHLGAAPSAIVAGDWNATLYARALRAFAGRLALRDASSGRWRRATWMPRFGPLGLDLDRVLVPSAWAVTSLEVGPRFGSDHLPIVAGVAVPSAACAGLP